MTDNISLPNFNKKSFKSTSKSSKFKQELSQRINTTKPKKVQSATASNQLSEWFYSAQEIEKRKRKERQLLKDLNEIWEFLHTPIKGSIMDVYVHLHDLSNNESQQVKSQAESILDFLDGTRMRGWS